MNKRIQKKVAKREALHQQSANSGNGAATKLSAKRSGTRQAAGGRRSSAVRAVAEQAREQSSSGAIGSVIAFAEQVQERTTEAIGQVKDKLSATEQKAEALYKEAESQLKDKLAETEERAEAMLGKLPVVGAAAARKLHDLTHR